MDSIGKRIAERRQRLRLSQRDLALRLGVSVQAVSQWERDKTRPVGRLGLLAEILQVPIEWMESGTDRTLIDIIEENAKRSDNYEIPIVTQEKFSEFLRSVFLGREIEYEQKVISTYYPIGKLFGLLLRQSFESFKEGDLLIFDTGLETRANDYSAVLALRNSRTDLKTSKAAEEFFATIAAPKAKKIALLDQHLVVNQAVMLLDVAVLVERRSYRGPQHWD